VGHRHHRGTLRLGAFGMPAHQPNNTQSAAWSPWRARRQGAGVASASISAYVANSGARRRSQCARLLASSASATPWMGSAQARLLHQAAPGCTRLYQAAAAQQVEVGLDAARSAM